MSKNLWSPSGKTTDLGPYPSKKAKNRAKRARKRARARLRALGKSSVSVKALDAMIAADPSLGRPLKERERPPSKRKGENKYAAFYKSAEWKQLRYATLVRYGGKCMACGVSAKDGAVMQVDHIQPISLRWDLRLDPENVQVHCSSCNWGKGNRFSTDWRPKPVTLIPRAPTDDEIHRGNPFLH